jgi:hypothetical protein
MGGGTFRLRRMDFRHSRSTGSYWNGWTLHASRLAYFAQGPRKLFGLFSGMSRGRSGRPIRVCNLHPNSCRAPPLILKVVLSTSTARIRKKIDLLALSCPTHPVIIVNF